MQVRRESLAWEVDPEFIKVLVEETHGGGSGGSRLSRLSTWKA